MKMIPCPDHLAVTKQSKLLTVSQFQALYILFPNHALSCSSTVDSRLNSFSSISIPLRRSSISTLKFSLCRRTKLLFRNSLGRRRRDFFVIIFTLLSFCASILTDFLICPLEFYFSSLIRCDQFGGFLLSRNR